MPKVSRSNIIDRLNGRQTARPARYDIEADEALLPPSRAPVPSQQRLLASDRHAELIATGCQWADGQS